MVVVKFKGGLGNQMFQYALYRQFELQGKDVFADLTDYDSGYFRKFELYNFPNININLESVNLIKKRNSLGFKIHKKINKLLGKRPLEFKYDNLNFNEYVLQLDNCYIDGYWQSEKYFCSIREDLKKQFCLSEKMLHDDLYKKYREIIELNNSISVHIRRGDYLSEENISLYGNICTKEYYNAAMRYFRSFFGNVNFVVFSNDIEWCKENIMGEDITYVLGSEADSALCELFMMTRCSHNIIANSSFSWWGAWLNNSPQKKVIMPASWLNCEEINDIYPEGWIRIDNRGEIWE